MITPVPPARRRLWTAGRVLRAMLVAQCLLALFVVMGDLPHDMLRSFPQAPPRAPTVDVPVTPGNQTRQFEPDRLPAERLNAPGLPPQEPVPRRLEFIPGTHGGVSGAVLLTGTISEGDADRFAEWLKDLPALPNAFALHSPGGSVSDALQIGRIIRDTGRPVLVASGDSCFSACPYILAGGAERRVSKQAFVGVHQHYFGENTYLPAFLLVSDIQVGQGQVMTYLADMGIDPMIMTKALMTPPDDIYILLPEELETYDLATILTE